MAVFMPTTTFDLMLTQAESTVMRICSGAAPTTYAAAVSQTLATKTMTGSYTKASGDVSGRKNTCPAQTLISIGTTGVATHVAITDGSSILKIVTTCTNQTLTSGGTVDTNAWDHEILNPT